MRWIDIVEFRSAQQPPAVRRGKNHIPLQCIESRTVDQWYGTLILAQTIADQQPVVACPNAQSTIGQES